jgi:L-ascorbate metabolism protein UlaG (beta-lactamase superfamily)
MVDTLGITFIGHATVLLEINGMRIITDPLLRNRVLHLRRQHRFVDNFIANDVDIVLISHAHWDHLDIPSLKSIGTSTPLIVPRGVKKLLSKKGFQQVSEVTVGESIDTGDVTIRATHADHDGARLRFGQAAESIGYIIEGSHCIYFPGGTALYPQMAELTEFLDLALLPVWGWGPNLGPGHMNPYQAALALRLLSPKIAIPIHWGTMFPIGFRWMFPRLLADPPHAFYNFAAKLAPDVQVKILAPGAKLQIE